MRETIVVGSGVAGLMTAVSLRASGHDVRILERRPTLQPSGTAVLLQSATLEALHSVGLGEAINSAAHSIAHIAIRTKGGIRVTPPQSLRNVMAIDRPTLIEILSNSLPDSTVECGVSVSPTEALDFGDAGHPVVAAEGVHSALRTAVFGEEFAATYTGATIWRGTVDGRAEGLVEYWGKKRRFGVSSRPGDVTNWYASARCERSITGSDGEVPRLHKLFDGWNPSVDSVLSQLTEPEILHHDSYELSKALPSLSRSKIAFVGDAAHAMTPDLGRGANEAILDGASLGRALGTHSTIEPAYAKYDHERRSRAQRTARFASLVNRLVHRIAGDPDGQ